MYVYQVFANYTERKSYDLLDILLDLFSNATFASALLCILNVRSVFVLFYSMHFSAWYCIFPGQTPILALCSGPLSGILEPGYVVNPEISIFVSAATIFVIVYSSDSFFQKECSDNFFPIWRPKIKSNEPKRMTILPGKHTVGHWQPFALC